MIEEISKIVNIIKDIAEYLNIEEEDKFSIKEIKKEITHKEEKYLIIGWFSKENSEMKCYLVCDFNIEVEVNEKKREMRIIKSNMSIRYYYKDE